MPIFRSAVNTPTEQQPHLATDRHAPVGFALNFMLAATLGAVALLFAAGGGMGWDLTGSPLFAVLFVPAAILLLGCIAVVVLTAWEIGLRYPRVPRPPEAMELPKRKKTTPTRYIPLNRMDGTTEQVPMDDDDDADEILDGFGVTEDDLRAFVRMALDRNSLSRATLVPDGHKIQLPSGTELSRPLYDQITAQMAVLGWIDKGGNGKAARWLVTTRQLARGLDLVTGQAGGHRAGGQ